MDEPSGPLAAAPPVVAGGPSGVDAADALAARLGLTRLTLAAWNAGAGGPVVVWCDDAGLALRGPAAEGAGPVRPRLPHRPRRGADPLLRAVGAWPNVVDATAGWGIDAATLAAAGREVVLVERHPVLAMLLRDAIERARAAGHPAAHRMRLVEADARDWLAHAAADVVLLDPMYPEAAGRAGARKAEGLHLARRLVGDDLDQDDLLAAARHAARRRVVVKRPLRAVALAGLPPSGSLRGRTVRYDLYAPEEAPP
jgi:16S rRNA (guanine1516-N2)-methyltransferase